MRNFFLILFLSISLQFSSQINTQLLSNSSWVRVKFSMLDGSRDLSQVKSRVLLWNISQNTICEYSNPIFRDMKSCVDFKLDKRVMKTSKEAGYQIEKLTSDSLIVTQRVDGVNVPDKIRKIWFVNKSVYVNGFLNKMKNDSVLIAIKDFTPSLTKNIISNISDIYAQKEYSHDFSLEGNILIFPKKQTLKIEITKGEELEKDQKSINLFKSTLEKNYNLWDLSGFEKFEKIIIPYKYSSKVNKGHAEISSMGITFFGKNYVDFLKEFIVQVKDKKLSVQYFGKGVEAINNKKFDKAIQFFNEAHEYDNTNTDALYNVVAISLNQNDKDISCSALKKLKDLEQAEGTKLFNENCLEK